MERYRRSQTFQLLAKSRRGRLCVATGACAAFIGLVVAPTWLGGVIAATLSTVALGVSLTAVRLTDHALPATELETTLSIARDEDLFERYRRFASLLLKVGQQHDPIFHEIALEQIDELVARLTSIAAGSLVFEGTETWRIVYERLLRSPGLYLYRSVAWVKTAGYWQDEPGRKSMEVNFELHEQESLAIERIAILADELWPSGQPAPVEPVRSWLRAQSARGISVRVVRQSALAHEPDLIADIGIYGSRALGTQFLDEQCRTAKFVLSFDFTRVAEAEARWNRLEIYAEPICVRMDSTALIE